VEFEGNAIYALCSKLYFVEGIEKILTEEEKKKKEEEKKKKDEDPNYLEDDEEDKKDKYSCKGIQKKQNEINKDRFHNVLFNNEKDMCSNKGFRVINNEMVTYIQHKKGLSYYYDKRIVLADGVSTVPLDI
jgi:outer membrane protein OmpA-like peptidoglycan-associated protein